jgi:hypothetical protein
MIMLMRLDYVSELRPPTGLYFIPHIIYEHGEPWWKTPDSSTRALWQSYQQSYLAPKQEELGEGNDEFGLRSIFVHTL